MTLREKRMGILLRIWLHGNMLGKGFSSEVKQEDVIAQSLDELERIDRDESNCI